MNTKPNTAPDVVRAFAQRLRANAAYAESCKFTVANLSTMPVADCRALADWIDDAVEFLDARAMQSSVGGGQGGRESAYMVPGPRNADGSFRAVPVGSPEAITDMGATAGRGVRVADAKGTSVLVVHDGQPFRGATRAVSEADIVITDRGRIVKARLNVTGSHIDDHWPSNDSVPTEPTLKPCPFCSSINVDPSGWMAGDGRTGPACDDCGASADSIDGWNRRTGPAPVHLPSGAYEALTNNQRQLDADGCEVGVSRQALDELLAFCRSPKARAEELEGDESAFDKIKAGLGDAALLADPNAIHVNMLRGAVAKPSWEQIKHLYPEAASAEAERDKLKAEVEDMRGARDEYKDKWQAIMRSEEAARRTYLLHTEALKAEVGRKDEALRRARDQIDVRYSYRKHEVLLCSTKTGLRPIVEILDGALAPAGKAGERHDG